MSLLEYNIRNFLCFLFAAGASFYAFFEPAKKYSNKFLFKKISVKKIMIFIACILLIAFLALAFIGIETKDNTAEITVDDIVSTGSVGDVIKTYSIFTDKEDENGHTISFRSPIYMSRSLRKQFESIKAGDRIIVKYAKNTNYVYYIEKVS